MKIDGNKRIATLLWIIKQATFSKMIVFITTARIVKYVRRVLETLKITHVTLFGSQSPKSRTESFMKFLKDPECKLLIATDVAGRGLDFPDVDFVVQLELPQLMDDYFHRVGRSARAGKIGSALTLIAVGEEEKVAFPFFKNALVQRYAEDNIEETTKEELRPNAISEIETEHNQLIDMVEKSKKDRPKNRSERTLFEMAETCANGYKQVHATSGNHVRNQNQRIYLQEHKRSLGL